MPILFYRTRSAVSLLEAIRVPDFDIPPIDEDAVLKEVWNINDIEAKTELNPTQIESINKLLTLADITDLEMLRTYPQNFMVLQKSLQRKSMGEFTDVVKARREDFVNKGKGFFSGLMG